MNFTQKVVLEDIGTDYKGLQRGLLRVFFYADGIPVGDKNGIVFLCGLKSNLELVLNGQMSITEFNELVV